MVMQDWGASALPQINSRFFKDSDLALLSDKQREDLKEGNNSTRLSIGFATVLVGYLSQDAEHLLAIGRADLAVCFFEAACKTVSRVDSGMTLQVLEQLRTRGLSIATELRQKSYNGQALFILDLLVETKTVVADRISRGMAQCEPPTPRLG